MHYPGNIEMISHSSHFCTTRRIHIITINHNNNMVRNTLYYIGFESTTLRLPV